LSPGCSPTSTTSASPGPAPKTVCVARRQSGQRRQVAASPRSSSTDFMASAGAPAFFAAWLAAVACFRAMADRVQNRSQTWRLAGARQPPGRAGSGAAKPPAHCSSRVQRLSVESAFVEEGRPVNAIRLVLADDHAIIRDALKLLLSAQPDLEVIGEAQNGQQAIDAAVSLQPDVLLMDVSMPGAVNGLQATAAVRRLAPSVKVLTLTRHGEDSYLGELLRAGAAGYALKQSSSTELLSAIRTVASGRPYLDPSLNDGLVGLVVRGRPAKSPPTITPRETEVLRLTAWATATRTSRTAWA
jgi:two-component system response regulator NreC